MREKKKKKGVQMNVTVEKEDGEKGKTARKFTEKRLKN